MEKSWKLKDPDKTAEYQMKIYQRDYSNDDNDPVFQEMIDFVEEITEAGLEVETSVKKIPDEYAVNFVIRSWTLNPDEN